MRYSNKVDIWIRLILYLVVVMYLPLIFVVAEDQIYILMLTMVFSAIILLPLLYGYVELNEEYLRIRIHLFHKKIYYKNIKSLRLCTNWLSSMAMTKDRIEIKEWNKGYILGITFIGPVQREEVLQELQYRCPNLENPMVNE